MSDSDDRRYGEPANRQVAEEFLAKENSKKTWLNPKVPQLTEAEIAIMRAYFGDRELFPNVKVGPGPLGIGEDDWDEPPKSNNGTNNAAAEWT